MNKLLIALAATAATTAIAATPAAAQWGAQTNMNARAGANISNRIAQLETRLQAGIQSGEINRTEARSLRRQVRELQRLDARYSSNGLSVQERQDLQQRLRSVRQQFRLADGGNNNGRWADSDDDLYQGQGGAYVGAYEEVEACDGNGGGGIGGLIGGLLGGGRNRDCVEVGERAPRNLGALPYDLRNQFRDGNGIAYRTDGQHIYQIDVRTNTVLRVYGTRR